MRKAAVILAAAIAMSNLSVATTVYADEVHESASEEVTTKAVSQTGVDLSNDADKSVLGDFDAETYTLTIYPRDPEVMSCIGISLTRLMVYQKKI